MLGLSNTSNTRLIVQSVFFFFLKVSLMFGSSKAPTLYRRFHGLQKSVKMKLH